jgi:hypothetical protein
VRVRACVCNYKVWSCFDESIKAPQCTFFHWLSYQQKSEKLMGTIDPKIARERTKELFSMSASFLNACSLLQLLFALSAFLLLSD